mmetsp:Transcript_71993/g.188675  ORF Transcript_71993/g.188675 Transcript_71993/m.188675 type:complete len:228 (-) Transcript_71993:112-795(-)
MALVVLEVVLGEDAARLARLQEVQLHWTRQIGRLSPPKHDQGAVGIPTPELGMNIHAEYLPPHLWIRAPQLGVAGFGQGLAQVLAPLVDVRALDVACLHVLIDTGNAAYRLDVVVRRTQVAVDGHRVEALVQQTAQHTKDVVRGAVDVVLLGLGLPEAVEGHLQEASHRVQGEADGLVGLIDELRTGCHVLALVVIPPYEERRTTPQLEGLAPSAQGVVKGSDVELV